MMKEYIVETRDTVLYRNTYKIKAESEMQARELIEYGDGELIYEDYIDTLESELLSIEEKNED